MDNNYLLCSHCFFFFFFFPTCVWFVVFYVCLFFFKFLPVPPQQELLWTSPRSAKMRRASDSDAEPKSDGGASRCTGDCSMSSQSVVSPSIEKKRKENEKNNSYRLVSISFRFFFVGNEWLEPGKPF